MRWRIRTSLSTRLLVGSSSIAESRPHATLEMRRSSTERDDSRACISRQVACCRRESPDPRSDFCRCVTKRLTPAEETGAGADALLLRPGLAAALKEARAARCSLIVSRLDRLSRNVHFITGLKEHKVHFVVTDLVETVTSSHCTYMPRSQSKSGK
jgi:DNA invertase Pin-like site-specific DNA recombinase